MLYEISYMSIKISLYHMLYKIYYIYEITCISDIFYLYMISDLIYKISVCIINSKMA